jgi:hypothetical protein
MPRERRRHIPYVGAHNQQRGKAMWPAPHLPQYLIASCEKRIQRVSSSGGGCIESALFYHHEPMLFGKRNDQAFCMEK